MNNELAKEIEQAIRDSGLSVTGSNTHPIRTLAERISFALQPAGTELRSRPEGLPYQLIAVTADGKYDEISGAPVPPGSRLFRQAVTHDGVDGQEKTEQS